MALVSFRKSDVPFYLQSSDFYLALDDAEDDEVHIPQNCFKASTDLNSSDDLTLLLSTLRFWGVSAIPASVVKYVAWQKPVAVIAAFAEFEKELQYQRFLRSLCDGVDRCIEHKEGAQSEWIEFIQNKSASSLDASDRAAQLCVFLHEFEGEVWSGRTCELAAAMCDEPGILRFLHEHGCPWDASCCAKAAEVGNLPCL